MALGMDASFGQAWQRLGSTLPKLGFKSTSESAGRGYRELKYKPLDKQEWLRLGVNPPNLEKGVYQMQISAVGKQSAVVITDEDGKPLPNETAQSLYSALSVLLAQ
jgi:outer membrane protein assembly factor BamC